MSPTSKSPDDISAEIRTTLKVTCPGLSCQIGTVERKIIDAVSEAIAEAYVDNYLLGSLLDIDTKGGLELEQFVGIFGFGRMQGRQAEGVVTVTLATASEADYPIALGTQFFTKPSVTGSSNPLYYTAKQATVLVAGTYTIDVPVQCSLPGVLGNVAPDSVSFLGTILGSSSVTNLSAMTGGVDPETDADLRQRFKDTLLRNAAGTSDFYEALCIQNNTCSKVKVFGPTTMERIQIAAPATSVTLPVSADVKYVWAGSQSVFKDLGQPTEVFYFDGTDYSFTSGSAPTLTRDALGDIVTGDVLDVEYEYTTKSSRNQPQNGIYNKVDIFVDGVDPYQVTERTRVSSVTLSATSSSIYHTGKFRRVGSTGSPTAGNRFTRISMLPLASFPNTLTLGPNVYVRGTHYHVILASNVDTDQTLLKGSPFEVAGIEWASGGPTTGTELDLVYVYNRTPRILQSIIRQSKQVCTDVLVHQADWTYIRPHLLIEYDRNFSIDATNVAIAGRLQSYFSNLGYGATVTMSGMLLSVMQVIGVVNAKVMASTEPGAGSEYGLTAYDESSDATPFATYVDDFKLNDNQLAQILTPVLKRKPIL